MQPALFVFLILFVPGLSVRMRRKNRRATADCSAIDCGWTLKWNCPGQPAGSIGAAGDDGSVGYQCCCVQEGWRTLAPVKVATLGGHHPLSFEGSCGDTAEESVERALCNLQVYEEAVKTAQASGVDLLLLPEYGLLQGSAK